jgi:hypothetical protein
MKKILPLALLATLALPALAADEPPTPPARAGDAAAPAADQPGGDREARRQERLRKMLEETPELKGVDPKTPEGEEKIRQAMQKRFETDIAPQIRKRMEEGKAANHAKMQEDFGMTKEEFAAIEPLLTRVEQLRTQKGMVVDVRNMQRSFGGGFGGGRGGSTGGGRGGFGGNFDPKLFLGDTPMDPSVQECQDARKALTALVEDKQANAAELATATARVRKGIAAFQAALDKAQGELKAVLTPRQESILVDRGILD